MTIIRVAKFGLSAITLFWASCVAEPSTTSSSALESSSSSLDPPVPSTGAAPAALHAAAVPGAKQVGFYDMSAGVGLSYEVAPIVAAGGTPINIDDPSAAALANLNVLWVDNPDNGGFGFEYLARRPEIAAAVQNGMVLVIHDRAVDGAAGILPAGEGFSILRDFTEAADINIRDASTVVTTGLDNSSLDNGNFSSHGFAVDSTLPVKAKLILTTTTANRIVTFCYSHGKGSVIYSTIPLDFYLQGGGGSPLRENLSNIYAPNVVKFAMAGACTRRSGPLPTPNAI